MRSNIDSMVQSYCVDDGLIAAVQSHAGARCHESASLLNAYQLSALAYQASMKQHDTDTARSMLEIFKEAERKLRAFLFQCRLPGRFRDLRRVAESN
jgi:hypothetical protein